MEPGLETWDGQMKDPDVPPIVSTVTSAPRPNS
jgi:hypothetical protein